MIVFGISLSILAVGAAYWMGYNHAKGKIFSAQRKKALDKKKQQELVASAPRRTMHDLISRLRKHDF